MPFKWDYPSHWLSDKIDALARDRNTAELVRIANELARFVSEDDIQDVFEAEMEADGYFEAVPDDRLNSDEP